MYFNCAITGYGDFTKDSIIPSLQNSGRFKIKYILVRSAERAQELNSSSNKHESIFVNSYEDILNDPEIDCLVIVTRHDKHKEQILQAVQAGKAVFTEKPMAMNLADAEEIAAKVNKSGIKLMVGLNRRFSPFAVKIKQILNNIEGPFLINYRWINKAWDAKWPFDPVEGGGKLVSSGCHMLDFVMFLLNDTPESVSAELKTMIKEDIKTHDTASLRLDFKDGSTVNVCTSELGALSYPQEKMEIFTKEGVIVMDNFEHLAFYGINAGDIYLEQQNKGVMEEMKEFAIYLDGKTESPCGVEAGVNVARCTAACLKAAESGNKTMFNNLKQGDLKWKKDQEKTVNH
jgi:predicted dehydrogenase